MIAIQYSLVSLGDLIFQPEFETREIFGKTEECYPFNRFCIVSSFLKSAARFRRW